MNRFFAILLTLAFIAGPSLIELPGGDQGLHAQNRKPKKKKKKKGKKAGKSQHKNSGKIDYLFIEANTQALKEKKEEAIQLFKEVLKVDPSHHASMYNIAKLSYELGDFSNTVKYAKMSLEETKDNYWYYFQLVKGYEGTRDNQSAIKTQAELVEQFPDNKDGLYDLAQMYIVKREFEKSIQLYDRLEKLIGMNEEVVFRKFQLYVHLGNNEAAIAELDRLIAFFPSDSKYYQAKHETYDEAGMEKEAIQTLNDLLDLHPDDSYALLSLADYYQKQGDTKKSDEFLFRAFRNPSVDLNAKVDILASLYRFTQSDKEIQKRAQKLGDIIYETHPPSALTYRIKADGFRITEQPDSARVYYLKSLDKNSSAEQVWQDLIFIDSQERNYEHLQKDAESALENYPNKVLFLYFFGVGSSEQGDFDEAIYAFEKVKKIGSTNLEILMQVYLSLAEIYHQEEIYTKSDQNFEEALRVDDNHPLVLNNYAYYLSLRNERLGDAEKMVLKALNSEPGSSAYQDTYGWILYLQGEYEKAREWIGKSVENGGGAEVLEHYGDVWLKLGDAAQARSYWQKAIDAGAINFSIEQKQLDTEQE